MSDDKSKGGGNKRSNYGDSGREGRSGGQKSMRSSASYKADLDKLFSTAGEVPERFQGLLGQLKPEDDSPEGERLVAIEGLRNTESFREFIDAVNAYRKAGHALPDDEDLLARMLDHPREGVLIEVLKNIIDLHGRRTIKRTAPLKSRLETVKTVSDDPLIHELADRLKVIL